MASSSEEEETSSNGSCECRGCTLKFREDEDPLDYIWVWERYPKDIQPFQFEPEAATDDSDGKVSGTSAVKTTRMGNLDWCKCGKCKMMLSEEENKCCQEEEKVKAVMDKNNVPIQCITEHESFDTACLHETVLQIAWDEYKHHYGDRAYDGPQHRKNRHTAFRQFVFWCYKYLGKDIRIFLPACVVSSIRAKFPPPEPEAEPKFRGFPYY